MKEESYTNLQKNLKNKELDFRLYELVPDYELLKEQVRENLVSPKDIEIRINRSIQVEGTFGQLKQNMQYIRIRRQGIQKVSCEIMLICLGRNIRKFFTLLDSNKVKSNYWEKPDNLKKKIYLFLNAKTQRKKLYEIILFHDCPFISTKNQLEKEIFYANMY